MKVNKARFIKGKHLILFSSLIAHPRCLDVLKTNSLPLTDAFILGQDEIVDSVLCETRKLNYIKRKNLYFISFKLSIS